MRNVDLIMRRNGASISFAKSAGKNPRFQRINYHHLRKLKHHQQQKQNVNEIEFILITTILLIHHIDVRQIKVSEINTQSQHRIVYLFTIVSTSMAANHVIYGGTHALRQRIVAKTVIICEAISIQSGQLLNSKN